MLPPMSFPLKLQLGACGSNRGGYGQSYSWSSLTDIKPTPCLCSRDPGTGHTTKSDLLLYLSSNWVKNVTVPGGLETFYFMWVARSWVFCSESLPSTNVLGVQLELNHILKGLQTQEWGKNQLSALPSFFTCCMFNVFPAYSRQIEEMWSTSRVCLCAC